MEQSTKKGLLQVHLSVLLFGVVGIFAKLVDLPSTVIVWWRVCFSAVFLLLYLLMRRQKVRLEETKEYVQLILTGAVLAVHWTSYMQAIQVSTVATGTLAFSTFPLFASILEPLVFRERFRISAIVSAVVMLAGVAVMVPEFSLENQMTEGILWGILSAFTYAVLGLINRKFSGKYQAAQVSLYEQAAAAVFLLPVVVLWQGTVTVRDVAVLAVLGIVFTGIAHSMFISGLKTVRVQTAGIISGLESVYGIAAAFLFLGEMPGIREVAGGAVILAVVFFSTWKTDR